MTNYTMTTVLMGATENEVMNWVVKRVLKLGDSASREYYRLHEILNYIHSLYLVREISSERIYRYFVEDDLNLVTFDEFEELDWSEVTGGVYELSFTEDGITIQMVERKATTYKVYEVMLKKVAYKSVKVVVTEDENEWDARDIAEDLDEYDIDWEYEDMEVDDVNCYDSCVSYEELDEDEIVNYMDIE